jgi:DNA polymerase-4
VPGALVPLLRPQKRPPRPTFVGLGSQSSRDTPIEAAGRKRLFRCSDGRTATRFKAGLPWATDVAKEIRARIRDELGLTASAGLAPGKCVAKIASDHRKPDGLTVVPPDRVLAFLHPLPVGKLPGIGPATEARVKELGLHQVGDLARADVRELERRLGVRGPWLHALANGHDDRGIVVDRVRKSRGSVRTFAEDVTDLQAIVSFLAEQTRALCDGLQRAGEKARTVTLTVRYADFTTITRACTLPRPTDRADDALPELERLLGRTDAGRTPVRLAGVTFSNFVPADAPAEAVQVDLPFAPLWRA